MPVPQKARGRTANVKSFDSEAPVESEENQILGSLALSCDAPINAKASEFFTCRPLLSMQAIEIKR